MFLRKNATKLWKSQSHGRQGFDRALLGSVAESVARYAKCSVEIVRIRAES